MHTTLNLHAAREAVTFEANTRTVGDTIWITITISGPDSSFEFTCFNQNEIGLAALAQAINQVNATHFGRQGAPHIQGADGYITSCGIIISPGKFEGEPEWAPYFYHIWLDANTDRTDDDEGNTIIAVLNEDRARFPELASIDHILIRESDQGFVHTRAVPKKESVR